MSDQQQYPSYRLRQAEPDGPPWRLIAMAGGLLALVLLVVVGVWGFSRGGSGGVPVIEADARPVKVRPDDPGGLRVPNQGELIFDQRPVSAVAGRLAPASEAPALDRLRAQTALPPNPPAPDPMAAAPQAPTVPGASPVIANNPTLPQAAPPAAPPPAAAPASQAAARTLPAVVAPPVPSGPPPRTANARVQVQLGALTSEEAAKQEWDRLSRRMGELMADRRPSVVRFEREGKPTLWRLRTGFFADGAAASSFCEAVKARGSVCAVIGG